MSSRPLHTSGMAVPYFVIDAPGGGGKIPVLPKYIQTMNDDQVVMRNFQNEMYAYPQVQTPAPGNGNGNGKKKSRKEKQPYVDPCFGVTNVPPIG